MAKKKPGKKVSRKPKPRRRVRGEVPNVVRLHSIVGASAVAAADGVSVTANSDPTRAITVVGLVKPHNATLDCQLFSEGGPALSSPRTANVTEHRFSVVFDATEVTSGRQYLFEANLHGTE